MITVDLSQLPLNPGDITLDIGCGSGRHTAALYDLDHCMAVGADTNLDDLAQARSKLSWHSAYLPHKIGRWSLACADISRLPFKDGSIDLVICSEVLEHIHQDDMAIRECIRVLKPGKHLVVSVPRRWPETLCWALSRQYRTTEGGHLRIYHPHRLIDRIQSSGVRLWKRHYAHGLHTPYWWLRCLVGPERQACWPVAQYHRFLTWDLMEKPKLTRQLEAALNPVIGKSIVLYFQKS
ncbi:MAG: class I SAM-dependent methyltransferase [Desulfobacteraceae bacterium]